MPPKKKYTEEFIDRVVELYEGGRTCATVSKMTGMSAPYVKTVLKKRGVILRPSGFQEGNQSRTGKPHTESTKTLMRNRRGGARNWINQFKAQYVRGAKVRGLAFELDEDEFRELVKADCFYCGAVPILRWVNSNEILCNGIDRVDNTKGYVKGNVVTACGDCNKMKGSFDKEAFIERCKAVAARHMT